MTVLLSLATLLAAATCTAPVHEIAPRTDSIPARAAFDRGRDLFELNRFADARAALKTAVTLDPQFAFAHALFAQTLAGNEAVRELDKAAELAGAAPDDERTLVEWWRARAHGDDVRADSLLDKLGVLAPCDWRIQLELGRRAGYRGQREVARAHLERAVSLNAYAPAAYNLLGYTHLELGRFEDAIAAMRRYVLLRPEEANPLDSLGDVYMRSGRYAEAEQAFEGALRKDPKFWLAATGIAYARFLRGDGAGARAALLQELRDTPDAFARVNLEYILAWVWFVDGRRIEAMQALEVAERDARHEGLLASYARAEVLRANFLVESGAAVLALPRLASARKRLEAKGISGDEKSALRRAVLTTRIEAETRLGKLDAAEKTLKALTADAGAASPLVHGSRAAISAARRDWPQVLAESAQCGPYDYTCRIRRADALEQTGDAPAAALARAAILSERRRERFHVGADPAYLAAMAKLRPPAVN